MKTYLVTGALIGVLFLAACDTAEERAERHYQSAIELLAEGDVERGLIELRNVFQLDGFHREARRLYADTVLERGSMGEAFGQYLRLVEQYPDDAPAVRRVAVLAIETGNWDDAGTYADIAMDLSPEHPEARAVRAVVDYRVALQERDPDRRQAALALAEQVLADDESVLIARQVVLNELIRAEEWEAALDVLDRGLELHPDERELYDIRLGLLEQLGRPEAIESDLRDMIARFPDDQNLQATLTRWYLARDQVDAAEAFLRERIAAAPDSAEPKVTLVRFLLELDGPEAARAELDRIIDAGPADRQRFEALRAGLMFDAGQRTEAIDNLQAVIDRAGADEDTRGTKVALARMLQATGNNVGARALVEEVLDADETYVDAMKMKAAWLIEDDRVEDAVTLLRAAFGHAPRDAEVMTTLARAHQRMGSRDLMIEMLGRAAEVSNYAPPEALRYVQALRAEDRTTSAEGVLTQALRIAPNDVRLLSALGDLYRDTADWPRLDGVIAALESTGDPEAVARAESLRAAALFGQQREDELMDLLAGMAEGADGDLRADIAIVRLHLSRGEREAAADKIAELRARFPDDPTVRYLEGAMQAVAGDLDAAAAIFREIVAGQPRAEAVWLALHNVRRAQGGAAAARAVLDEALAEMPESVRLNWALAGLMEEQGDLEGAIAVYEDLYARNTDNTVFANNLASLISVARDDDESLARAYAIARRLRGLEVPAFQDTYGWLASRRGDHIEALAHLEPAAEALAGDPRVQYHLAMAYARAGQGDAAGAQFERAAALIEDRPDHPLHPLIEAGLADLASGAGAGAGDGSGAGEAGQ